jgi:hypothetical protein
MLKPSDHWIAFILTLFCGTMTFFLVRSEYFPESSPFHRLPPWYVAERLLRHESSSTLKVTWKGEDVGTFLVRVIPGAQPLIRSSAQVIVPVLGKRPRLRFDLECVLKKNRDIARLNLNGRFQEIVFEVVADSDTNKFRMLAQGEGINEKREFPLSDLRDHGGRKILKDMPGLPSDVPIPSEESLASMAASWQFTASSARIDRRGDWMDAYLMEARVDGNSWVKLWISPTGELLKLESSFGLSAMNDDFFEGLLSAGNKF